MPLFGAHMSIAGGLHHAVLSARAHGCPALQLFTKNFPIRKPQTPT
jgi:endonuclease IV